MSVEPIELGQAAVALASAWWRSERPQFALLAMREKPGEAPRPPRRVSHPGAREPLP